MLCILPSWACVVTKGLQNTSLCDPTPQHHAADGVVMPGQDVSLGCLCWAAFSLRFSLFRCNKLGLDRISSAEEPSPEDQVEETTVFVCAQSAPLNQEPIVCADIGTAHSAAVTGEAVCPNSERGDTCIVPVFLLPVSHGHSLKRHPAHSVEALWSRMLSVETAKSFRGFSVSQVTPSCVSPLYCQPLASVTPLGATSTGSWAPTPAATAACPTWLWGWRP